MLKILAGVFLFLYLTCQTKRNKDMNRLSIKNVEFSERLSEETHCFAADIYLDNRKFGYAKNNGHGGSTDVHAYPNKGDLFKEAEAYAESLPDITSETFKDLVIKSNLEHQVDELFSKWLKRKEENKGILFKDANGRSMIATFNKSIRTIMKSEQGRKLIQKEVKAIEAKGGKVLNENLEGITIRK
jgi:hypothetical protein